ncbi:hypothetical protein EW026_g6410 [Hermanssonia centrifuga]|uniref:HMA domain-containing protein n=1 Tax=Hermanssonia centrifuga TaxID=98765 RepID=A0A4S4KB63_9APHY|nr:hypothetical protein EW026_g6410 [Hermanssonia centrifuga]
MTCVGCENKLIKVLKAQPIITNVKTSLVLSRAEFDYAGRPEDLQALIQTIQQRTGFATERIESAHALEFIVSLSLQDKFLHAQHPDGVQQVAKGTKNTVRVIHDPQVIGAREVLSFYAYFSPILAPEPQDPALAAGAKHIRILLARTIASSILTIPVLVMTWAPLPSHPNAYAIASLVLASFVQIVIAGPFYGSAFKGLFFSSIIENDSLIVLSTTTAYIYSVVAFAYGIIGKPLIEGSFFETSTLLVTLIMFGQLASALARQRAIAAISLRSLQQPQATLVHTHPDGRVTEELVDARLIQYGDTFRVLPDSVVITDGVILSGTSSVDESMMTGESLPVEKSVDREVLAGSVNGPGNLLVKVTRLPGENTISEIAGMVDSARGSRARVQSIVDRVCAWFVPVVLAIALVTFMIWILIGVRVRKESTGQAAVRALTYAIAVLAISCPCAIGLAVPMVVLMASGVAARLGLVFKAATTIESARKMTHVVFDKTGTLTMGRLEVVYAEVVAGSETPEDEKGSVMLALASASKHPVSRAVATYLISTGVTPSSKVDNLSEVTGKGVEGSMGGRSIRGGSARWLGIEAHPSVQHLLAEGLTTFCVMDGNTLIAVYALSDTIRPEAASLLVSLRARNIGISVLSGDHAAAVDRVSSSLGIPSDCVRAGCLPADKAVYIRELQAKGAKVMFCGDGTNDSVALAQADIGVHMSSDASSSGAGAAASGASDAVLLRPSLTGLMSLVELSEAVHKRIIANFLWAAIYNLVAILFAGGAFVNARIAPAYAGLGEIVSVLPVILVAMQLKWFKASV